MPRRSATCLCASTTDEPETEAKPGPQRGGHDEDGLPDDSEWSWDAKISSTHRELHGHAKSANAQDTKAKPKTETSSVWSWPDEEPFEWDVAVDWALLAGLFAFLVYACLTLGYEALRRTGVL